MALLSREELLNKEVKVQEEEVEIPILGGSIKLRGVKDAREMDEISMVLRKVSLMRKTLPQYRQFSEDTMHNAVWVAACIVEPDMNFDEVLEFGSREGLGPWLRILAGKVLQLSGLSENLLKEEEEKLEGDTFPLLDTLNLSGILTETPIRSESLVDGLIGDIPLQQNQE